MIYVVGSGPAAISAAEALGKGGHAVTILDYGLTLEADKSAAVATLASSDPGQWAPETVAKVTVAMRAGRHGVSRKYSFGSDFPYRQAAQIIGLTQSGTDLQPSLGRGGFSNVWGAAVLPPHPADITDWPLDAGELNRHFAAIAEFMPVSGCRDGLEKLFPVHGDLGEIPVSRQARDLLQELREHQIPGLISGQSRLAVRAGCRVCGLCMHGCPYGLIYNSADTLGWLRERHGVIYRGGILVQSFEETAGGVRIRATENGRPVTFGGDAVFIGAGVLSTAKIVLESLRAHGRTIAMRDSQYFLLPILRRERAPGAYREELHTMAQAFLEFNDPVLSPYLIHLQAYTYNPLYEEALRSVLGPLAGVFPIRAVTERMLLLQGYLHSRHGRPINITLTSEGLQLEGRVAPEATGIIQRVAQRLAPLGWTLPPTIAPPGRGFHAGGTFPMRQASVDFTCDRFGRLHGFERVHLIDASVLPSIPATTVTYAVMANAHRIGTQYAHPKPKVRHPVCLLTGANGYVGSSLADYLGRQGIAVIAGVRQPAGAGRRFVLGETAPAALFSGIECFVHAAYDFAAHSPAEIRRSNIEGSVRFLVAAAEAGVKRGVVVSSLSAFPGCRSHYGRAKLEVEEAALRLGYHVVRPGLVYGPTPGGMVSSLARLARRRIVPLIGRGRQLQYLTHQDDLGELVLALLRHPAGAPLCVTAANAEGWSMREIIVALRAGAAGGFVPVPWRLAWTGLKLSESLGFRSRLRSDSLVAMMHPNPRPDFSTGGLDGVTFRPFSGPVARRG